MCSGHCGLESLSVKVARSLFLGKAGLEGEQVMSWGRQSVSLADPQEG